MNILCPKHHVSMQIEKVEFEQLGYKAYIAKCPQCECLYIDRHVFKSTLSFTISGMRYEFLPELSALTEKLRIKEQEEAAEILREKEALEQKRIEAERKKLKQQREAEKRRKKQKEAEENRKKYKDSEAIRLKALYSRDPNRAYRATFVKYYDGVAPTICPVDGEQLVYLSNAHFHNHKGGLCCLRCSRIFLPKGTSQLQKKTNSCPGRKEKSSSAETIAQNIKFRDENPHRAISPLEVFYYSDIAPQRCLSDHTSLLEVNNIKIDHNRNIMGLWCPLCNRCYIRESELDHKVVSDQGSTVSAECVTQADVTHGTESLFEGMFQFPKSTVLAVKLRNLSEKKDVFTVIIVTDAHEQDADRKIMWIGRALPSHIMIALQTSRTKGFTFKNRKYKILEVKEFSNSSKYLNIVSRFCNPSSPQSIYVFSQKNIPSADSGDFECVTAMIPCANRSFPVPLTVYFQKSTHSYFINEATYTEARKNYGLPYLRLCSPENTALTGDYSKRLRPHSLLNLLGYSVSYSDGLSAPSRHVLLANIINSRIMSKADVMNHIEWLIHSRVDMDYMENAVSEWRDDLKFLMNFNIDHQRTIYASSLRTRFTSAKFDPNNASAIEE